MNRPSRLCPRCGGDSEIGDDESVWPHDWSCPDCAHKVETLGDIPIFAPAFADTIVGMNPASFAALAQHEDGNYWFVPRRRLILGLLKYYFRAAECIMEIGCGTGFLLSGIANMKPWRRLIGSELHPSALAIARSRLGSRAELVQMDAREIPARDVFDVIGAFDVLEHIEEDEAVLAAMHRALRTAGGILLAVPQHPWLWSTTDERALHVRRYRRGELERKVEGAGFRVLFSGSYTAVLLPLMAASRWSRPTRKSDSINSDLQLPPIANAVLKTMLQTEVTLTLAGLRFPVGGSRVVVAAKPRPA
jgi:SAM-dependent methyltransferase